MRPPSSDRIREFRRKPASASDRAARELDVEERTMRYWCSGARGVPQYAVLALERLASMSPEFREDLLINRWQHSMRMNDQQIGFLESGKVSTGSGPGAGSRPTAETEARFLRGKNDAYQRRINMRVKGSSTLK